MNGISRPHIHEQFQSIGGSLPGAELPWLAAARRAALARFDTSGFPSPREEDWKYTNVAPIEKKRFSPSVPTGTSPAIDADLLARYQLPDAWSLVVVDGALAPELSSLHNLPAGVLVTPLSRALCDTADLVQRYLGGALENERHGFIAFNTAFFSEGLLVHLPDDCHLTQPVQLLHISTGSDRAANLRNLIRLGRGASARIVETFVGTPESSGLCSTITELALGENAGIDYHSIQSHSARTFHFGGTYASVGRAARFNHVNLSFGGLLVRNDIHVELAEGSESSLDGLFLGRDRQHIDNHTLIHHRAPHATSRESYRGILADRSRGVFQGRIVVHPDAQKTDAQMSNRNLLLSHDAEIDTKPQLEIHADDVKCSHGVAIGQLDERSVYYLQSRGVDAEAARHMLTFAFANVLVDGIAEPLVKDLAQRELMALFPHAGIRRDWL